MGDNNDDNPITPVVTPVVETSSELINPVVDHTEKITRLEERQAQEAERLMRELSSLEERLSNASGEKEKLILERIDALDSRLTELATKPVEKSEEELSGGVEMVVPEVQTPPSTPEKQRMNRRSVKKRKRTERKAS